MADFKPPKIDAQTPPEQIRQIKHYLIQLTQQLNYELRNIDEVNKIANERRKNNG